MAKDAGGTPTCSERIAKFVAEFDLDQAPSDLIGIAERGFVDTIGVMLAGSREPAARMAAQLAADEGAAPVTGIVGRGFRTSPQNAALANGTATQALDYDLSFMMGQSSAALIPGLLPLAESTGATPREMIAAFIVGSEVCGALGRSYPLLSSDGGWHGAGVLGTISAAAAYARLTGQPVAGIPDTIGIAASMASAISVNFGTMTKPLHAGLAARNGVAALGLGAQGFTAHPLALEGKNGFFACFAQALDWDTEPFERLGQDFALLDPGIKIKAFACGGLLHCSIQAALSLRERENPDIAKISRIGVGVNPHAFGRAIDRYPWSEDSSRFSLRYLVPYALIHGAPILEAFTEAGYGDAAVRALGEKYEGRVDAEFAGARGSGRSSPGRVTLEMTDGTRLEEVIYEPLGYPSNPLSDEALRNKFESCAAPVIGAARAAELFDYLSNLSGQDSLTDLWPLITVDEGK
jgi:2-methylcitrate dehydratase PrpD